MKIVIGPEEFDWANPAVNLAAVLLGAALTWVVGHYAEKRKRKDEDLATAYSLMFKVQKFTNELMHLERHVAESKKAASEAGVDGPAWTMYSDIIGFTGVNEKIYANELTLVARTKDIQLVMDLRQLESAHSIALNAVAKISEMRTELGRSGLVTKREGQVVSFEATPEQYAQIAPLLINLESLADETLGSLPDFVEHADRTANRLGSHLKEHYKFRDFVTMSVVKPN